MLKRTWGFIKESGLFGNILYSLIIMLIGALLPFLKYVYSIDYIIKFSIPIFTIIGIAIVVLCSLYIFYIYLINPIRMYSNLMGYYRKLYKASYYPYLKERGIVYTRVNKVFEYRITRNGITSIGPVSFYAYRPRSINGKEELSIVSSTVLVNGCAGIMNPEISPIGTDEYSITIRSVKPLKAGDLIEVIIEYRQIGLNAVYQEELDIYKILPDLKNVFRNRLIKEKNVELISGGPQLSSKYRIEVIFPEEYPWKLLDNVDDIFMVVVSARPVNKRFMKLYTKHTVDRSKLCLEYNHKIAHGY